MPADDTKKTDHPIPFWPTLAFAVHKREREIQQLPIRTLFLTALELALRALDRADWGGAELWLAASQHAVRQGRPSDGAPELP